MTSPRVSPGAATLVPREFSLILNKRFFLFWRFFFFCLLPRPLAQLAPLLSRFQRSERALAAFWGARCAKLTVRGGRCHPRHGHSWHHAAPRADHARAGQRNEQFATWPKPPNNQANKRISSKSHTETCRVPENLDNIFPTCLVFS
jgi:hypothetical protein